MTSRILNLSNNVDQTLSVDLRNPEFDNNLQSVPQEKQLLQKTQKGQMEKMLKENQVLRANQIKAHEKARKPG